MSELGKWLALSWSLMRSKSYLFLTYSPPSRMSSSKESSIVSAVSGSWFPTVFICSIFSMMPSLEQDAISKIKNKQKLFLIPIFYFFICHFCCKNTKNFGKRSQLFVSMCFMKQDETRFIWSFGSLTVILPRFLEVNKMAPRSSFVVRCGSFSMAWDNPISYKTCDFILKILKSSPISVNILPLCAFYI